MSLLKTEMFPSQARGGLHTCNHVSNARQFFIQPLGFPLVRKCPLTRTAQQVQQQQEEQKQQQQQQPIIEEQDLAPTLTETAALLSSNLLRRLKGCDVIDNKTSESIPIYIQKHQRYIMNDVFHREDERLKTFDTWPLDWMDKRQLAQTGMFYTGEEDKVKCYFCEVEIGRWEHSDHPVSEHLRWFPNCPLLRRRTTNNVPIDAEALDRLLPPVSYDICGANDSTALNSALPPFVSLTESTTSQTTSVTSAQTYYPEYPEYAIEAARLRSFAEWPRHMRQKPEQLAEAGFFYIGSGDRVKCFSCGGGLKDWADEDEPWEQHTLWMSNCRFLKLMKGQNYIDNVLAKQQKAKANSTGGENAEHKAPVLAVTTTTLPISSKLAISPLTAAVGTSASLDVVGGATTPTPTPTACHKQEAASLAVLPARNEDASGDKRASSIPGSIPEEKLCKICYADEYNTAFLPCGHVVACAKCASSVTKCPLCRKPFTDVMRVYFS